jgi:uncharacterized repeat protein (TIGR03803 family)
MRHRLNAGLLGGLLAMTAVAAAAGALVGAGGPPDVIHSFGDGDGEYPATDLVVDSTGTIYGTTTQGGGLNSGTVFALSPSGQGWDESVIYSFTSGPDGGQPYNGVTLDTQGNLYGTAVTGGTGQACEGGCGVVYKLTKSGGTWTQSVLYNFTGGNDGSGPGAGLTFDRKGNLYGMAPTGGEFGVGVIYKLAPDGSGGWTQSVLHAFTGGADGATGSAGRLMVSSGRLYGVATVGGANGKGTVFRLNPQAGGGWTLETLYAFKGPPGRRPALRRGHPRRSGPAVRNDLLRRRARRRRRLSADPDRVGAVGREGHLQLRGRPGRQPPRQPSQLRRRRQPVRHHERRRGRKLQLRHDLQADARGGSLAVHRRARLPGQP